MKLLIAFPLTAFALLGFSCRPKTTRPPTASAASRAKAWVDRTRSQGIDAHLAGHSLATVLRALEHESDVGALYEAADFMEEGGYPIAAERLRRKALYIAQEFGPTGEVGANTEREQLNRAEDLIADFQQAERE